MQGSSGGGSPRPHIVLGGDNGGAQPAPPVALLFSEVIAKRNERDQVTEQ